MTGLLYMSKTFQYIRTRTSANTGLNFMKSRRTLQQVPANTSASPKAYFSKYRKTLTRNSISQLSIVHCQLSIINCPLKKSPETVSRSGAFFVCCPPLSQAYRQTRTLILILYIINIKQTAFPRRRILFRIAPGG